MLGERSKETDKITIVTKLHFYCDNVIAIKYQNVWIILSQEMARFKTVTMLQLYHNNVILLKLPTY